MKKILILLIILFISLPAQALKIKTESLSEINSETSNEFFDAQILTNGKFESGFEFKKYDSVHFKIVKIVPPKVGKRSAYMVIKPVSAVDTEYNITFYDDNDITGKTACMKLIKKPDIKKDLKKNAKNAAFSLGAKAANTVVPGSAQLYQLTKGILLPEEGKTRLQSATSNVVDNSVLKHFKAGDNLEIKKGDTVVIDFYHEDMPKRMFRKRRK